LPAEPLFIDVSDDAPWDHQTAAFREKITSLAAPIHGKPKDELASDDLREQRRFRRLRAAAIAGLAMLTVISVVAAVIAVAQRQTAIHRLHDAVVAKLNAEGAAMLAGTKPGGDVRALQELLAANAIQPDGMPILDAQIARFTTEKIIDIPAVPRHLAYSPDGRRIASGQDDGTVRQWDPATGAPVGATMHAHSGRVTAVAYTPDGHTIVSTSADGTLRLSNADTGAAINQKPPAVDGGLVGLAINSSGKTIVTAGGNDTIRTWDPRTGQPLASTRVFSDPHAVLTDIKFDRSGTLFAVSSESGQIAVYDSHPVKLHVPVLEVRQGGVPMEVGRVAFSADGHTIAAGSTELQLWNVDTGTVVRKIALGTSLIAGATAVAYSPDGRRIATGRLDGPLQLWDAETGAQLGATLLGHTNALTGVAFSPDGTQIASAGPDGSLRLWRANVGQAMQAPSAIPLELAFDPDGRRLAVSGETAIQQWDVGSGNTLPQLLTGGPQQLHWFGYVAGGRMATALADGTVQIWDVKTAQPLQPPVRVDIRLSHIAFSSDGRLLAALDNADGNLTVWDVATGHPRGHPMTVDKAGIFGNAVAFSPDNQRIAAGYADGARLWEVETSTLQRAIDTTATGSTGAVISVAFSRDGATLATGSAGRAVQLRDSRTLDPLPDSTLAGHTAGIFSVAFGVGNQLASGSIDGTLRLWNAATRQPTASPQNRSDTITAVAVSPDGQLVASATADRTVLLSPGIADPAKLCDKLSANMSRKQWRDWVSPGIDYIQLCPKLPVPPD
jgi:WD40 repeat protein